METGGKTAAKKRAGKSPIKYQVRGSQIAAIAAILLTGLLAGCAGLTSGVKKTIQAAFQVNPGSVSFGKVNVGKQATQTIAVTNTGNTSLSITQVSFSNPQFSLSGAALPMALGTGQSANMTVALTPTSAGAVAGTLTAQGNNGSSPVTVNLSATAVNPAPQISLSASSLQLGTVTIGSTRNSTLTISNLGTADLNVSLISLAGTEFAVSGITTPKTIAAGTSATATLAFQPTTAGAASGTLTITSNDPNTPSATVSLSGTGTATAITQIQASPTSLRFGNVTLGASSTQNIILSNTGTAGIQISSITVNGAGISGSGVTTPLFLNPGASATVIARFAPTVAGSVSGNFVVASDATGSPMTIPVTGTGVVSQPALSVSPMSFAYGSAIDGQSKSQKFTLSNTGTATLTISQLAASGAGFSVNGLTTPVNVAPGASTAFNAVFAPTTAGNLTGSVTITSNDPGSPATIALSGTGVANSGTGTQAKLSLTPSSANLGSVTVGSSNSQTMQISNPGNAVLTITQATVTGSSFSTSGLTLPLSVNAGSTSTFNVVFRPTFAGLVGGNLSLLSNAAGSPTSLALSGTGVAATLALSFSATNVNFGNVSIGSSSTNGLTITNTSNSNVQISGITISGAGYTLGGASTPVTLTPSQSMTFSIIFTPTVAGTVGGSVTVASNANGSPSTITLSGTGVTTVPHTVSLSWTASTTPGVVGYNVYRSTTNGTGYTKINSSLVFPLDYTDNTVANGTTYYYVTTALDGSGNESPFSNQATAVIP